MIVRMLTLVVLLGSLGFSCASCTGPTPVPNPLPPPQDNATCETACARGAALGCTWAAPTPKGAPCTDVCQNAATLVPWNVGCLSTIATCNDTSACP